MRIFTATTGGTVPGFTLTDMATGSTFVPCAQSGATTPSFPIKTDQWCDSTGEYHTHLHKAWLGNIDPTARCGFVYRGVAIETEKVYKAKRCPKCEELLAIELLERSVDLR